MGDRTGVVDSYYLKEAFKPSARMLGVRCGKAAISMLSARFADCVGATQDDRYSYITRSAVEEHEQDAYKDSYQHVLIDAIRDAALGATETRSDAATETTRNLLQSEFPTLVRVGLYVCGENYGSVGHVFWQQLKPEWFWRIVYWHELFWLIKKAFSRFSASERQTFLRVVADLKGEWHDPERQLELDKCQRRDVLHAAARQGDAEIDNEYDRLVSECGPVREQVDFHAYHTSGWVGERTPVASDALASMPADALGALLRKFVPDQNAWDGATYRGFADALSAAVRASDDAFVNRFHLFAESARPYQHGLLRGLKERWSEDRNSIDWARALDLIEQIVGAASFKSDLAADTAVGWEPSVHWVVGDIANLIKAGSVVERSMGADQQLRAAKILSDTVSLSKPTPAEEPKDAVSHAINSPRGQCLEALIHVALAIRRSLEGPSPDPAELVWGLLAPTLEHELELSVAGQSAEFATLGGMYCANLHYLNPTWVTHNFARLFPLGNRPAWRCAAQGFAYQRYVYDWLYGELVAGRHLREMIYAEDVPEAVKEKALQFVGVAYLQGHEELNGDGVLAELIRTLQEEQLQHLCWFFWTLRSGADGAEAKEERVLAFWRHVAAAIRDSGEVHAELQSNLGLLAVFISDLTADMTKVWAEAAPHAQARYHGNYLVEYLLTLVERYPAEVVTVFRAALDNFVPEYDPKDIIACVERLAKAGHVDDAEWICKTYAAKGSTLLNATYKTLRENQRSSGP